MLRSRVTAATSASSLLTVAGTFTEIRELARWSILESDMGERAYHDREFFACVGLPQGSGNGKGAVTGAISRVLTGYEVACSTKANANADDLHGRGLLHPGSRNDHCLFNRRDVGSPQALLDRMHLVARARLVVCARQQLH